MKKHLITIAVVFFFLSHNSYSQIVFENGYFINESGQKINCLIKNIDWNNNPKEFEYKIAEEDSVLKANIQTIKEFGIIGISKYIRVKVNIDRSSDVVKYLSSERNPDFREENLFLKVLIEGKASLYIYGDGTLTRFFYQMNDSTISQLVYKSYLVEGFHIAQNNLFRQQLFTGLICEGITSDYIDKINYNIKDLEKIFSYYNECSNSEYVNYETKQKKFLFNLNLRPGLNYCNLIVQNNLLGTKNEFGYHLNFRFGIETELILPFNKNKWSVIIEPTYQYFIEETSTNVSTVSGGILIAKVNYQSIEIPVGIRHYFYFNESSKLFINTSIFNDFNKNSYVELSRNDGSILKLLEIHSRNNLSFGFGYKYKDKYSIEMRYLTNREVLGDYLYWSSDYKTLSVIFGYTLF